MSVSAEAICGRAALMPIGPCGGLPDRGSSGLVSEENAPMCEEIAIDSNERELRAGVQQHLLGLRTEMSIAEDRFRLRGEREAATTFADFGNRVDGAIDGWTRSAAASNATCTTVFSSGSPRWRSSASWRESSSR
jgi:hypothetical protein